MLNMAVDEVVVEPKRPPDPGTDIGLAVDEVEVVIEPKGLPDPGIDVGLCGG